MAGFLSDVLNDLQLSSYSLSDITFILPSKRAGRFLKKEISQLTSTAVFAPEILSIEQFVEHLSQLNSISQVELLFQFYDSYKSITDPDELETFESVSQWASILIQDFNEIDRYLIEPEHIFDHIKAIKKIDAWLLDDEKTELIKNHLAFWSQLLSYYNHFTTSLLKLGKGYQGLLYREAVEHLESYVQTHQNKLHVFLGFNALNKAESVIIQELLKNGNAKIYWDFDEHYVNDSVHEAGHFIRAYKQNWRFLNNNSINWIQKHYEKNKRVMVYGVPKHVGQAKTIAHIIGALDTSELQNTAVVLADELLLLPLLNSIPNHIEHLNITMGFPLTALPISSLFEALIKAHQHQKSAFYYKDIMAVISHPIIKPILNSKHATAVEDFVAEVRRNNLTHLNLDQIKSLIQGDDHLLDLLFGQWHKHINDLFQNLEALVFRIKEFFSFSKNDNALLLEQLYRIHKILMQCKALNDRYGHMTTSTTFFELFKELLKNETLDFEGEPLIGLQIMGMLESRLLDFDTIIMASVNEGILPSGKQQNSFIPFDVKLEHHLPIYKEKDAVYAYHFYRLIQRAKNLHLIYNTEPDVLNGGEKSRFITQMEVEGIHNIQHNSISTPIKKAEKTLRRIRKTPEILSEIETHFKHGVSPSALLKYIRNPIDYYYHYVLGIKEDEDVEELVATNTLGTVVHESLRILYEPFEGHALRLDSLEGIIPDIESVVRSQFSKVFKRGDITKGKNLIVFEIAKRYVYNYIKKEQALLKQNHVIDLISVEKTYETKFTIDGVDFPIRLKGQIDRVDVIDAQSRVIDFKTGHVKLSDVEIVNWEAIIKDYEKHSKAFQVLFYALLLKENKVVETPFEAGIISFKNLKNGFLKFSQKDKFGHGAKKQSNINTEILQQFSAQLKELLLEILNPDIDFIEKEID